MKYVAAIFLILASPGMAQQNPPHVHGQDGIPDWYDSECCSNKDCHPVEEPDFVEEWKQKEQEYDEDDIPTGTTFINNGWRYTRKKDGAVAFFPKNLVHSSKDGRYHVCHGPAATRNGDELILKTVHCIYIPTTARVLSKGRLANLGGK